MSPRTFLKERKTFGWRTAWNHFYKRRHLPLYGYLALTVGIILAINMVRTESGDRREAITAATQKAAVLSCNQGNQTRSELRFIIRNGIPPIKGYVRRGLLTPEEGEAAISQSRAALKRLKNIDCTKISIDKA